MVKTRAIRLRATEGSNARDRIAFLCIRCILSGSPDEAAYTCRACVIATWAGLFKAGFR